MKNFFYITRYGERLCKRLSNQFYAVFNRIKFALLGIKYGKHLVVHGFVRTSLGRNATVSIGDYFCFLSGRSLNALGRNLQGCICINENAKLKIGNHVGISSATLWAHESITIGNNVDIGANTILMDSDAHSLNFLDRRNQVKDMAGKKDKSIVIGDDVLIGANCIILKGVTIGERSVVGAGSVVTKNIPADSIAVGNPAIVVKDMRDWNMNILNKFRG